MNTKLRLFRCAGPAALGLLVACSGGNISVNGPAVQAGLPSLPVSTSEPFVTYGTISGFGDLTVNGVRFTAGGAAVTLNGAPGTLADLELGQLVTVRGRISDGGRSGTAQSIRYEATLIGRIEDLDGPGSRLIVMGQTVTTGTNTVFGAGIDPSTYAGLAVGDTVRISGFVGPAGEMRATRIDAGAAAADRRIIGIVSGLDTANLLFRIGRLTVDYRSALLIELPGGQPVNGMAVNVIGSMSGGRLLAERLATPARLEGNAGQRAMAAGVIARYDSPNDFDVNWFTAAADAGTAFVNGDAGDLALNAEVVIDGELTSGGRISAERITFGRTVSPALTLSFDLADFTEIGVSTVFDVTVRQGNGFLVEVLVDADAADRVDVQKTGSRLNIALRTGDGHIDTLHATVSMPRLDRIDIEGVVNARLVDFGQADLAVNVGGVSRLSGNGLAIGKLLAAVSGVSQLDLGNVSPLGSADISVQGVSQATLNMDVGSTLTGSVGTGQGTGTSVLFYYGTNVRVNVSTDASSSVIKLGETRS